MDSTFGSQFLLMKNSNAKDNGVIGLLTVYEKYLLVEIGKVLYFVQDLPVFSRRVGPPFERERDGEVGARRSWILFLRLHLLFDFTCLDHITKKCIFHFHHLSVDALHFDLFPVFSFISPQKRMLIRLPESPRRGRSYKASCVSMP